TLALGLRCRSAMPQWAAERVDRDLQKNEVRHQRIKTCYARIAEALNQAQIDFVVLKGFTHIDGYVDNLAHRPQYDLDLLIERDRIFAARDVLVMLSYQAMDGFEETPIDHLPVMLP